MANWQSFGTIWDNHTMLIVDADWENDDSRITMAAVYVAQPTVGTVREQMGMDETVTGEDVASAYKLALPMMINSVASCAEADEETMRGLGIMVGVRIKEVAESMKPVSRTIDDLADELERVR
jgi:hypothetical protein|tara:strand:+ start:5827 stop:6195 length:369 start_codon:yes stop_codon:yes gene_type:complete